MKGAEMKESRRDFIKTSTAAWVLTVTKATAQPASPATATVKKKIGFLVSTQERMKHDNAFSQALSDNNWPVNSREFKPLSANDDYGPGDNTLKALANVHVAKHVDLIVAAGGLPTAVAVASVVDNNASAPPFIFLIGRYPISNSGVDAGAADLYNCPRSKKVGGVDQATVAQDQANFQQLKAQPGSGVTIDTVGLIVNDNNPINVPETDAWLHMTDRANLSASTNSAYIYHLTGQNDQAIPGLLQQIRTKPQPNGIVVSADPYLREVGEVDLDAQLRDPNGGNFQGWVCYPYSDYVLAPGAHSIHSTSTPALATNTPAAPTTAYYRLGLQAVTILNQLANSQPLDAGLTTWNASTSSWNPPANFP